MFGWGVGARGGIGSGRDHMGSWCAKLSVERAAQDEVCGAKMRCRRPPPGSGHIAGDNIRMILIYYYFCRVQATSPSTTSD